MNDYLTTPGQVLRFSRHWLGLGVRRAAALAGVSPNTVRRLERDQSSPTPTVLGKLALVLGRNLSGGSLSVDWVTQPDAIAAARKLCDPDYSGRLSDGALTWLRRFQGAGWITMPDGRRSPLPKVRFLRYIGRMNRVVHRPETAFFVPDGHDWFSIVSGLARAGIDYAMSGGPAANQWSCIGGGFDPLIYVEDISAAADAVGLEPWPEGRLGRRVCLLPFDGVGEAGRWFDVNGFMATNVWTAHRDQVAIDCFGTVGRGDDQAEAVLGVVS